jgi:hypothetical protein
LFQQLKIGDYIMAVRCNSAKTAEVVSISLDRNKYPIAFENRVKSLMDSGLDRADAERVASERIALEILYDPDCGLFALESEAIDSITEFFNPYTGESIEVED